MQPTAAQAAAGFRKYRELAASGSKVFYGPLYSAVSLRGLCDQVTHQVATQEIPFFQVAKGQTGQGFTRPLRYSETSLDGGNGQLPAGYGFVGLDLGVYMPPTLSIPIKEALTRHSSLAHVRHSHRWEAGCTAFWPEASYGVQSKSVATTIAASLIQFAVNGATPATEFPEGGELYFPPNEQIQFTVTTHENFFCTGDGLVANGGVMGVAPGGNEYVANEALLYVIMRGYRYEHLTA
jgi:hypothetical protein